jgi:hypothetical protein
MTTRTDLVRRHVKQLSPQARHLPGASIFSTALVAELHGFTMLVEAELAGRSRVITERLEALQAVLAEGCRVGATNGASEAIAALQFDHEIDSTTAARILDMKPDTLRKKLRTKQIKGRQVNGHWLVPLSAIEEYHRKAA